MAMEFSGSHGAGRDAAGAPRPHLAFGLRSSADPTDPGGDVPDAVYQTWVAGDGAQDSSTPQVLGLVLSPAAAAALARASGRRVGRRDVPAGTTDSAGGELGAWFRTVLVRSDLRPVEAWDPVACAYAPLQLPQSTFSFARAADGGVAVEVRRKHLPPSKNHGDVLFRIAVRLEVDVDGGPRPIAVSSAFRIFSKQSTAAPRPEPKRRRNPAPTKPFVAPLDACAAAIMAAVGPDAPAGGAPPARAVVDDRSAMPPPPPRRRSGRQVAKRPREDADGVGTEHDGGDGGAAFAWHASVPRAEPGSSGPFRFPATDSDDTAEDDELSSLERTSSAGSGSVGWVGPEAGEDCSPPRAVRARLVLPVPAPAFRAVFASAVTGAVPVPFPGIDAAATPPSGPRASPDAFPSGSPLATSWGLFE